MKWKNNTNIFCLNPISCRGGGRLTPPQGKTAITTPKSNDTELKKFDFSQKHMGVPPIPFWGLEMAKKGFL